jgi:hypothetical protein
MDNSLKQDNSDEDGIEGAVGSGPGGEEEEQRPEYVAIPLDM